MAQVYHNAHKKEYLELVETATLIKEGRERLQDKQEEDIWTARSTEMALGRPVERFVKGSGLGNQEHNTSQSIGIC